VTRPASPIRPSGGRNELLRRGLRLEYLTVGWNIVEGLVAGSSASMAFAKTSKSPYSAASETSLLR
jgi:hypothetical protein